MRPRRFLGTPGLSLSPINWFELLFPTCCRIDTSGIQRLSTTAVCARRPTGLTGLSPLVERNGDIAHLAVDPPVLQQADNVGDIRRFANDQIG